jgi:RNA polymerase sigma-70 factor (ECF subfamily)
MIMPLRGSTIKTAEDIRPTSFSVRISASSVLRVTFSWELLYYLGVGECLISLKEPALSPDDELMVRVRNGELDKLAVLYERYNRALFAFFFKVTLDSQASEDLVQTVFFKIIKYRDRYRAEEGSFVPWMFRIAHNARSDHFHSLERSRNEVRIGEEDVRAEGNPGEDFLKKESSMRMKEALGRLTEEQREVLILSRYQGLKYEEIAEILKCRVGTVKARVFRAVEKLRRVYGEIGES